MSVEEEIARTLHAGIVKAAREDRIIIEVFDETPGFDFELDLAKSLSPLLNRVRAEALREHGRVVAYWERGHSPKVLSHSVERIVADLEVRAATIEQNSEGNET